MVYLCIETRCPRGVQDTAINYDTYPERMADELNAERATRCTQLGSCVLEQPQLVAASAGKRGPNLDLSNPVATMGSFAVEGGQNA